MENLEDIDKETLISLLKDKSKELKNSSAKLNKIEDKYVKIFKENKNLNRDRETFEKFFKTILENEQETFTNIEAGNYDIQKITELFNKREDEKYKIFSETIESCKQEKAELELKVKSIKEELSKAATTIKPEVEKQLESSKNRIDELEKANGKLSQEIKELSDIIENKNKEIQKLKSVEYEVGSLKAEILMKELHIKNMNDNINLKSKMEENERKNQIIKLKTDLEAAQDKIKELEIEKDENSKERLKRRRHTGIQTENSEEQNEEYKNPLAEPDTNSAAHILAEVQAGMYTQYSDSSPTQNGNSKGQMNQEYLKNVILKFFCYMEGGNYKEAGLLMNAICTILKMSQTEREMIEEARKNNNFWNNALSFIKDTFVSRGDVNFANQGK